MDKKFFKHLGCTCDPKLRQYVRDVSALLRLSESDIVREALRRGLPIVKERGITPAANDETMTDV